MKIRWHMIFQHNSSPPRDRKKTLPSCCKEGRAAVISATRLLLLSEINEGTWTISARYHTATQESCINLHILLNWWMTRDNAHLPRHFTGSRIICISRHTPLSRKCQVVTLHDIGVCLQYRDLSVEPSLCGRRRRMLRPNGVPHALHWHHLDGRNPRDEIPCRSCRSQHYTYVSPVETIPQ